MPANLPPKAKAKWAESQATKDPERKLRILKEFYSSFHKHKGTEKLEMSLKKQIKNLEEDVQRARSRKAGSTRQEWFVSKEGLKQVALVGSLPQSLEVFNKLTGIDAHSFEALARPLTGTLKGASTQLQLVLAPFDAEIGEERKRRTINLMRNADILVVVFDDANYLERFNTWSQENGLYVIADTIPVELKVTSTGGIRITNNSKRCSVSEVVGILKSYKIENAMVKVSTDASPDDVENAILGMTAKQVVYLLNDGGESEETGKLAKGFTALKISSLDHDSLALEILRKMNTIRVFTKGIGEEVAERPILVEKGRKVIEVATEIHKDLARNFKHARLWRNSSPAIRVGANFTLEDRDIIEIHA